MGQSDRDSHNDLVAYLVIGGAAEALEFYKKAFGAEELVGRIEMPDGRIGHAELRFGNTTVYVADEHPEYGYLAPKDGSPVSFVLTVPDADAAVKRAVDAGATLTREIVDQFYGYRSGEVTDRFGYRWTLSTKIEDLSEEEIQRRASKLHESL